MIRGGISNKFKLFSNILSDLVR